MLSNEASRPTDTRDGKLILIVEDNELNMRLLNDVLEAHGYSIIKTDQGEVAVELSCASGPT